MARILPLIRRRAETSESPFWISYADLMTALVMLFMVVMSISMVTIAVQAMKTKEQAMVEKEQAMEVRRLAIEERRLAMEERQLREKAKIIRDKEILTVLDLLASKAEERKLDLTVNRTTHTISFGEKARFAHDSFLLSASAKKGLQAFVPLLLEVRASEAGHRWLKRVHIEGYTDETGTYLYNVYLSLNRAQAVVCALFATDLDPERRRKLRSLLMIDGATVTSIKQTREESRRVEVRLEFRQLGDKKEPLPVPEMSGGLGRCAITMQ